MLIYQILGFMLIIIGAIFIYGAKIFVKKYNLDKDSKCNFEEELTEVELAEYKLNKAVVNLKIIGMLVVLPGILLIYFAFK